MSYMKNELEFLPPLNDFRTARTDKPLTVFAGANNSGKSLVLKWLKHTVGRSAYMIGTNRFYHVYHFSSAFSDPREIDSYESQFNSQFREEQYNYEQNYIDLNKIIIGLNNTRRNALFSLCGELIGSKFLLKRVDEDNDLSVSYIDVDGQNLSVSSTGTRLLMTVLGICMDERFTTILIDEPELGLRKIQHAFAVIFGGLQRASSIFSTFAECVSSNSFAHLSARFGHTKQFHGFQGREKNKLTTG